MNEPKRQHSVPAMLQRRFLDERGKLWFFDKGRPENGVIDTDVGNLFVRNRQYTLINADGTRDWSLETRYSGLEGEMNILIDKLVDPVTSGNYPTISPTERQILNQYLYEQWRRVPEVYDRLLSDEQFAALHRKTVDEFEKRFRPVTVEERNKFSSQDYLRTERRRARVASLSKPSSQVLDVISRKGLFFARTAPRRSFIIGSVPVQKLTPPGQSDLGTPEVELWLAIHPNVAVVFAGEATQSGLVSLPTEAVRRMNLVIAEQSSVFAGRDKALVTSIASRLPRSSSLNRSP